MTKKILTCLSLTVFIFLGGCAINPGSKLSMGGFVTNSKEISFPEIGEVSVNTLGDTLVSTGYKTSVPAVRILERWVWFRRSKTKVFSYAGPEHWVDANTTSTSTMEYRHVESGEVHTCFLLAHQWEAHFNWFNKPGTGHMYFCEMSDGSLKSLLELGGTINNSINSLGKYQEGGVRASPWPDWKDYEKEMDKMRQRFNSTVQYEKFDTIDVTKPSYIQEFIYNGRVDNSLKFIYREFSGDYLRPSFTQEVQYDLNLSSEIGFKDLKLEVIKATNTEITYKLISNF